MEKMKYTAVELTVISYEQEIFMTDSPNSPIETEEENIVDNVT